MTNSPEEKRQPSPRELQDLYERRVNIMDLLREQTGLSQNTVDAILVSYDLQSGSYLARLKDPGHRKTLDHYTGLLADVFDKLDGDSILEAGVGEATSLCPLLAKLRRPVRHAHGVDLAWSRLVYARKYAGEFPGIAPRFSTGDLFHLPFADGAFDIVFTSHAIEPNHGRERQALEELHRVARKWIVLCEPSYELGGPETRQHIEKNGYCRDLPKIARELGYDVVEHRLFEGDGITPHNQTALLLIRKPGAEDAAAREPGYACPRCHQEFRAVRGHHFCQECLSVYPILDGIPCLLPGNGILASKYCEATTV